MDSLVSTAQDRGVRDAVRARRDGSVEIAEVWLILWQRRAMIAACAAALATVAALYSLITPSQFTATSQILVDPRDRIVMNNDVNPNTLSPDGGLAQVESQSSVLRSNGVLIRAIRASRLAEDQEFAEKGLLTSLLEMLGKKEQTTSDGLSPAENRALERLRKAVAVKRADKTLVLDVIVTTKAADKSAAIANAIAEAYLADQAEARSRNARDASASITARLAEQRRRVEEAENAVERYRVENNLVTTSGRPITDQQLGEMSSQYAAAQARVASLRAQVENISRRRDGTLEGSSMEATQSAVIAKLREQESTLLQRDADLQTQLGPMHPSVQASRNQLENVRRLIATEIRRVEQTVRAELDRAIGNERQLAARLETLTRTNQGLDQAAVRLRDLQRDLEAARAVYGNFLLRAQETREQATLDTTNARIISRALPPRQAAGRRCWLWSPVQPLSASAAAPASPSCANMRGRTSSPCRRRRRSSMRPSSPFSAVPPPRRRRAPAPRHRPTRRRRASPSSIFSADRVGGGSPTASSLSQPRTTRRPASRPRSFWRAPPSSAATTCSSSTPPVPWCPRASPA